MVTMSQRIESLREERGLSRPALAAALGFPKNLPEKFETGRQTPTKEQQEKMAAFFGVSLFYLRGESGDRTRQDSWMDMSYDEAETLAPVPAPQKNVKASVASSGSGQEQATLFDALKNSKPFQETLRAAVLEVLRSPEGQELLSRAIRKELSGR